MIRPLVLALVASLASCLGPEEDAALPPVGEEAVALARAACQDRGGRFAPGGAAGTLTCFITPRDAGKQCRAAGDCSTACLARSNTCAPVTPLFGCHDILTASGARVTECIE